jgi:hypothetical protein
MTDANSSGPAGQFQEARRRPNVFIDVQTSLSIVSLGCERVTIARAYMSERPQGATTMSYDRRHTD